MSDVDDAFARAARVVEQMTQMYEYDLPGWQSALEAIERNTDALSRACHAAMSGRPFDDLLRAAVAAGEHTDADD